MMMFMCNASLRTLLVVSSFDEVCLKVQTGIHPHNAIQTRAVQGPASMLARVCFRFLQMLYNHLTCTQLHSSCLRGGHCVTHVL